MTEAFPAQTDQKEGDLPKPRDQPEKRPATVLADRRRQL